MPGCLRVQANIEDGSPFARTARLEWDGREFRSQCDCPQGERCRHVAALGLAILEHSSAQGPAASHANAPLEPGQEVILYSCWVTPPPKKLAAMYPRPVCLWLALDSARLRDDLSPGTARPLGLWSMPKQQLREEDQAILELLLPFFQAHGRDFSSPHARGVPLRDEDVSPILELLTGYAFVYGGGRQPMTIRPDRPIYERRISSWPGDDSLWELEGAALSKVPERLVGENPAWVILDATFHPVVEAAVDEGPDGGGAAPVVLPQSIHPTVAPVARLVLREEDASLVARLSFVYGSALPLGPTDPRSAVGGELAGAWGFWQRDPQAESALIRRLKETDLETRGEGEWSGWGDRALGFLMEVVPELEAEGWEVYGEDRLTRLRVDRRNLGVSVQIASGIDWFDMETLVTVDGSAIEGSSLLQALRSGSRFVRLGTGAHARLPEEWLARQLALADSLGFEASVEGDRLQQRLPRYQALAAQEVLEAADAGQADQDWHELLHRLQVHDTLPEQPTPVGFVGELRGYQRRGLDYLCFLREQGLHGILADDMGLGKSIQAIALLLHERAAGRTGPVLLIAPTSVVYNWQEEFARFAPSLRVTVFHGSDRSALASVVAASDVVVTSYALLRRDLAGLREHRFHYVILDEAQMIKNARSQSAKAACSLKANHRLCLTGTPIENSLIELWSLFQFLMPGYLGNERQFRDRYLKSDPIEQVEALRRRTKPFILRRLKLDVAPDLPPRSDMVSFCELGPAQRHFYDELLASVRSEVLGTVDRVGLAKSRFSVLVGLLRLRQACCDPQLVRATSTPIPSAKVEHLMDLVREISAEGHRVLVFSQFVKALRILADRLGEADISFEYLDGQTKDRLERVHRFNEGKAPVFLISLKAGGAGLNLTGADYVVLFDPWWNPAVEEQATDRAHRIGQTRHVFSYKLIARDTIEEKVVALQQRKRQLAKDVLEGPEFTQAFSREDLEFLFS